MSGSFTECFRELRELRVKYGTSTYDRCVRQLNRERVNSERGKKTSFTWSQIKRAYNRQRGICPICQKEMALDRRKVHGDHINSQLSEQEGLNTEKNLACCHSLCNMKKSSKSMAEMSKMRQLNPTMGDEDNEESS